MDEGSRNGKGGVGVSVLMRVWPIALSRSGFDDRVQLLQMVYICVIYLQWLVPPQNNTLKINCLGLDNFS
jgi:hypothetical protein